MADKKKILVIDDSPAVCNQISDFLRPKGFDVQSVTTPDDFIDMAAELKPDLIFISLLLAESNGLKLNKAVHSIQGLEKVPVIMLISHPGELDPRYTVTIGIVEVMVKPLNENEILTKTLNILGKETHEEKAVRESHAEGYDTFNIRGEDTIVPEKKEATASFDINKSLEEEIMEIGDETQTDNLLDKTKHKDLKQPTDPNLFDVMPEDRSEILSDSKKPVEKYKSDFMETPEEQGHKEAFEEPHEETGHKEAVAEWPSEQAIIYDKTGKSSFKKIILISVAVLFTAVFVVGGLFFYSGINKEKRSAPALPVSKLEPTTVPATTSLYSTQDSAKNITETSRQIQIKDVKPESSAPQPETTKSEKETSVKKEAPGKKSVPEKSASSKKSPASTGKTYSVQLGYFGTEQNAISLMEKFKNNNYDAFIKKESKDAKTFYRVLAGKFDSSKKAAESVKAIMEKEGLKTIIYQN
jgi:DNA-binding response OmpR family regulator/cell division septation protein DedD